MRSYACVSASVPPRKHLPDGRVFIAENPGAEALEPILLRQIVALLEGALIGEKDPFAQLIAVKEEPGAFVFLIPLNIAFVGFGELLGVERGDRLGGGIQLYLVGGGIFDGRAGVPVVTVEGNAQRELLFGDGLE